MIPNKRIPAHPGIILSEEFLKPAEITQVELARRINAPTQRVNEIVKGKRGGGTPDRLAFFSGFRHIPPVLA
jgi:plasmid maintenance system antidote protein VapI